ncbi:hypothetical protein AEAC466_02720 [Asticcacaulis sp. AC466]|nr:hypothetical protein AEAC466_02720 [Asticcacaulis sp. AC466]
MPLDFWNDHELLQYSLILLQVRAIVLLKFVALRHKLLMFGAFLALMPFLGVSSL